MKFGKLKPGDHFQYGPTQYVRLPIVPTGTTKSDGRIENLLGYVNAARIGDAQLSGFGPECTVKKIGHSPTSYNGFFKE